MSRIKSLVYDLYVGQFVRIYRKQYRYKLKSNHIANSVAPGESEWGGVWNRLNVKPLPECYRLLRSTSERIS